MGLSLVSFLPVTSLLSSKAFAAPVSIDRLEASVNSTLILKSDVRKFRDTLTLRAQLDPLFTGTAVATKGAQASDLEITEFNWLPKANTDPNTRMENFARVVFSKC